MLVTLQNKCFRILSVLSFLCLSSKIAKSPVFTVYLTLQELQLTQVEYNGMSLLDNLSLKKKK